MSAKGISVSLGAMTHWWAMGAAMTRWRWRRWAVRGRDVWWGRRRHVVETWDALVEGQVAWMGLWSLGPVARTSVWDVGVPLVGSKRGESG